LDAEAGVEESRYLAVSRQTSQSPVFSTTLGYQPWPTTTIGVGATRQITPSLINDEVSQSTSFNVQASQRLLVHYYLSLQASSGKSNYLVVNSALANARGDTTDAVQASLSTMILERLSLSLTASRVRNLSSVQGFGLSSNQFGFQAALRY
jgi:hypothetical protein